MRLGTPGFIPGRLVEAREARGLSASALADMIGVRAQSVSYYETGKHTPGPEILTSICERLGLPPRFFVTLPSTGRDAESAFFYRSMSTAGKAERRRAAIQLHWLRDLSAYVTYKVELPKLNLPDIHTSHAEATTLSNADIEDLATQVRRHWGMGDGPISNVAWLLENNGIILSRMSLALDKLDGLSAWFDGRPYMVLNSDKESAARSRFDAAHELGHVLLHRYVSQTKLNDKAAFKLIEEQAHRFSGAFLFPARAFALEIHPLTLDHLIDLKRRWRLSIGFMLHRASDLGILSGHELISMWRRYNFKHWKKNEPLDDELPVERPRMLQRAVDMMIRGGACTSEDLLLDVPLPASDIERLAGLPEKYFSCDTAEVIDLQPRLRAKEGPTQLIENPRVLELRSLNPRGVTLMANGMTSSNDPSTPPFRPHHR